jgi:hypothetical protein
MPYRGSRQDAVDAISALYTGQALHHLPLIIKTVLENPKLGTMVIVRYLRKLHVLPKDPHDQHDYVADYPTVAAFLARSAAPAAASAAHGHPRAAADAAAGVAAATLAATIDRVAAMTATAG